MSYLVRVLSFFLRLFFALLIFVYLLKYAGEYFGVSFLVAAYGATSVILYTVPQSSLARFRNVLGGHLVSCIVGLSIGSGMIVCPIEVKIAISIALATTLMFYLDILHPPGGALAYIATVNNFENTYSMVIFLCGTSFIGPIVFYLLVYASRQNVLTCLEHSNRV